jgi:LacI family transcriptional regulator
MNEMKKRATISDVARLSGVSITTVSRVINDNYPVNEVTKAKVRQAIETLEFSPNLLARSLIQDKSQTIGVLTPSIENLFFSQVIKGIDQTVKQQDYRSFLCNTEGDPAEERNMIDSLMNRTVDGIVVIDPRTENITSGYYESISKRIPLVLINGYNTGIQCNFVLNDDITGTLEALRYFKEQGYERIGLLRGKQSHSYDLKEKVFREFYDKEGRDFQEHYILHIEGSNTLETVNLAKEGVLKHLESSQTPCDALLCCNDFMAVGALNAARAKNLNVPADLSIIGFDNTIVSQITEPPLSTVDHHMSELGETAAHRMLELIDEGYQPSHYKKISVATKLILRNS